MGLPRVLHVAQPVDAGVARCVAQWAAAQRRDGVDVHVACPPGGHLTDDLTAAGVPVHRWDATRSPGPSVPAETRALARIVAEVDPGLVHLHSAKAGLAGRLAIRGRRPTAFSPHAWSFDAVTGPVRAASLAWERAATRWTSLLVCVSDAERMRGRDARVRARRTAVVPNGVDLQALSPAGAPDRARARAALGLPDGPLAVCVGRLARQKGQDVLVEAFAVVRRELPDAALVLVGDGPDRASLTGRGAVLVGDRDDVADWLAAADVVVVPSRWEGMALVPLEAMARARSVVASDVTGVRESVPRGAGAIVAPDDPRALATALTSRLRDGADHEGLVGRAHVERHHDLTVTVGRLAEAYREALA